MFVVARRTVDELLAVIREVYNDECNLNKVSAEKIFSPKLRTRQICAEI